MYICHCLSLDLEYSEGLEGKGGKDLIFLLLFYAQARVSGGGAAID